MKRAWAGIAAARPAAELRRLAGCGAARPAAVQRRLSRGAVRSAAVVRRFVSRGAVRGATVVLLASLALVGCERELIGIDDPDPPEAVEASYYAGAVTISWELPRRWNGETFRIYGKRSTDTRYALIAEVTSCANSVCAYTDRNVQAGRSYDYYVASVSRSGVETASDDAVRVQVPMPTPPPVPDQLTVVALDHANYLKWGRAARGASDFSFYRVYLRNANGSSSLLGETDSEGFLDLLAQNGLTYAYFVTSVDDQGHESSGSAVAKGTPRPDYSGEWIYDFFDKPASSGFRFRTSDQDNPIVSGTDPLRHFRLETDADGWWLVPGPNADVYAQTWATTALKCGPAADADCKDVTRAPTSGYVHQDLELIPQNTYVLRVRGDDGQTHYGAIRVTLLGTDQKGLALMIFDWSYQLQPGSVELAPRPVPTR